MNGILAITISALMLSAPAFADTVPKGAIIFAYQPVGNGDPNAISCWAYRTTPPVRGLECARNSEWVRLNGAPLNGGARRFWRDTSGGATFAPAFDPVGPSPRGRELSGQ